MVKQNCVAAIIQARMTSSRLPGKVLMALEGESVLDHMIRRVRQSESISRVIVATTRNKEDDPIVELCESISVDYYRGEEEDVLGRMYQAAATTDCDSIVRLTGDCPMIDPEIIDKIIAKYRTGDFDYVSNTKLRTFPDGLDVEVFTFEALLEAHSRAQHGYLREHVTPYISGSKPEYGSGTFRVGFYSHDCDLSHIRWTLDTYEDYKRIKAIVEKLPDDYKWLDALSLATKHPEFLGTQTKCSFVTG